MYDVFLHAAFTLGVMRLYKCFVTWCSLKLVIGPACNIWLCMCVPTPELDVYLNGSVNVYLNEFTDEAV